jgi:hypothetical protein
VLVAEGHARQPLVLVDAVRQIALVPVGDLELQGEKPAGAAQQERLVEALLDGRHLGVGPADDLDLPARDIGACQRLGVAAEEVAEGDVGAWASR